MYSLEYAVQGYVIKLKIRQLLFQAWEAEYYSLKLKTFKSEMYIYREQFQIFLDVTLHYNQLQSKKCA